MQRALNYLQADPEAAGDGSMRDNLLRLKSVLLRFEGYLEDGIAGAGKASGRLPAGGEASHPGEFIFDVFRDGAGIVHGNLNIFVNFVKKVSDVIMEFKGNTTSSGTPKLDHFREFH